jgi:hypothetical protein
LELVLGEVEDVVPETSLQVAFHFRKVEVGSASLRDEVASVVEEENTIIE